MVGHYMAKLLNSTAEQKLGEWAGNTSRHISNKQFCNPYMNNIDHRVCMPIVIEKSRLKKANHCTVL